MDKTIPFWRQPFMYDICLVISVISAVTVPVAGAALGMLVCSTGVSTLADSQPLGHLIGMPVGLYFGGSAGLRLSSYIHKRLKRYADAIEGAQRSWLF